MIRSLVIFILTLVWVGAAVVLASPPEGQPENLRIGAAIVTGLPGAFTAAWSFLNLIGKPPIRMRLKVKWMLKTALIEMYRSGQHRGDISQVSLHVWIIPRVWRLFPGRIRRRSKVESRIPDFLRARLVRLASYRLEHKEHSNVARFRMGKGLVGRCVASNEESDVHVVRFYEQEFKDAIKDDHAWHEAPPRITQGLRRELAEELAKKYSQAAAVVFQRKGAPVGCVTLELPLRCSVNFPEDKAGLFKDPRIEILRQTAKLVEREFAL